MEKRVILFLLLSLAILLGYDYLLREMGITPPPTQPDQSRRGTGPGGEGSAPARAPAAGAGSSAATSGDSSPSSLSSGPSGGPEARGALSSSEEQTEEVVTDLFRAVLTTRGAAITSWQLTRYTIAGPDGHQPIQLIHTEGKFHRPLSIQSADAALNKQLADGLYQVDRDFMTLDASHPVGHLTFAYRAPGTGITVEKRLTFRHHSYVVDVSVKTEGLAAPLDIQLGTNFGIVEWGEGFIGLIGPASLVDDKIEKVMPTTVAAAAVIKKEGEKLVSAGVRFAPPAGSADLSVQLYAGPKEFDTLKSLNAGLEDTIDFGWFIYGSWDIVKAVAKPLFYVLRFLYDYTHNYGLAIILLTVGVKLLFVPLQYKSYKSMKDMQVVQPKVVALQAKYKDDRDRLNRELIKLYRDHKVNPVGGCLPMLLQMPVFVALFNILYMTIDLRQAPFLLWITDLSVQDPYYVLPVIMGATMVLQQKIMPTTMDPIQAKVMLLLPAMLTILFLTFPAGLVLYWLTNNVLTIGQQFITDRYFFKKPTFSLALEPAVDAGSDDGEKQAGKRKKDKVGPKPEADTHVET
ncbi:MAG: hypothetical protein AUH21_04000 [Nitrospirae bacterium 13_2_20CM_62_7]|nr:MAG: hypothetical protein AUH21_04000 [Nitrospirae bacterium 13_2_20CM_62_7]